MFLSDHCNIEKSKISENRLQGVDKCGFCDSRQFKKLVNYSSEPIIDFIQCEKCGAITYSKILKQEEVDKIPF